jgi:hypothetical protein
MVQTLFRDMLILDPTVQPRATMPRSVIADYIAFYVDDGAEALPPIMVFPDGSDARRGAVTCYLGAGAPHMPAKRNRPSFSLITTIRS